MKFRASLSFLILIVSSFVWYSCNDEKLVYEPEEIDSLTYDTTYIDTNLPNNILKNVLVEHIAGVRSSNCPNASKLIEDIQSNHDVGRVVGLTLHSEKYGVFTSPYTESQDSFNTSEATLISQYLIGDVNGLPSGAVDRKLFSENNKVNMYTNSWEKFVNIQLNDSAQVGLKIATEHYQRRKYLVYVRTSFIVAQNTPTNLSLFLVEDHILSAQLSSNRVIDQNYEHNSILRFGFTPYDGELLRSKIAVDQVFEKGLVVDIPENFNVENCSIVAIVNKNDSSDEVLQCLKFPLVH
ncbi:MAG: hypothetical protein ACI8SE_001522 [Bacteroidia bacterium]|jgi:hypothetical protein